MKKYNGKACLSFLIGVIVLTLLDQWSKMAAVHALKGKQPIALINDVLELYYLENTGMAWGMMAGARIIFLVLTVLIFALLFYVCLQLPATKRMLPLLAVMTLTGAGAVGNFIDRLVLGYVRDFIYVKIINFPVFNVADMYVTISVVCFAVLLFFVYNEDDDFAFLKKNKEEKVGR